MVFLDFLTCFSKIVSLYPNNDAVLENGTTKTTYLELYYRAAKIGNYLKSLGLEKDSIIGICLDKSAAYITTMLGSWFANAAFLPLDPNLPKVRLNFIVQEAETVAVITSQTHLHLFDKLGVKAIDYQNILASNQISDIVLPSINKNDLAYVIYTSGSTGNPKGVMVEHSGIVNFLKAQIPVFQLTSKSRSLFYLSTSFDAAISDIGTSLLSGAAIYIESAGKLLIEKEFWELLARRQITHIDLPPSLLRVLDINNIPKCLETIIIGGEICPPATVRHWAKKLRVVNVYGPTETTVCSSLICCNSTWDHPFIGEAIDNTKYHLLDENLSPVNEVGKRGELYISGVGLARGYLNRPELTEKKFIYYNSERLYKTGDLVVLHENGQIEFLGRVDRQVKLRGMLVELAEIESALIAHPAIEVASVVKRKLEFNKKTSPEMLVAFVVLKNSDSTIDKEQLSNHLSNLLPQWMSPQRFEILDTLPKTISGKVDLQQLMSCPLSSSKISKTNKLNKKEAILVKLWQQVLALDSISPTDNLFELGANSLAIMQVATLAQAKGLKLSVSLLIRNQTIRELVKELDKTQNLLQLSGAISTAELCKDVFKDKTKILSLIKKYKESKIYNEPGAILLTGATGFLGSRLLAELLQKTDKSIYCLVRATNIDIAKQKILNQLVKYNIDAKTDNLAIILGDLSKKQFGLSKIVYQQLASKIDVVYHCAALVHMVLPYSKLRLTNVAGTMEILNFVCSGRKKVLHYASTLSVFVASDQNKGLLLEEDKLKLTNYIYGGYAQSKWVAEYLLHQANKELNTINFYRFGLLTGDSQTAYFPKTDFLAMFIKGISQLGCVPAKKFTKALAIDITPIDYAAKAMLEISVQPNNQGKIFHIANPNSLSFDELIQAIQSFGLSINFVSQSKWKKLFTELKENQESEKLSVYLALCRAMSKDHDFERNRVLDLFQATGVEFSTSNTELALKDLNVAPPTVTEALLHKYFFVILGKNNNDY